MRVVSGLFFSFLLSSIQFCFAFGILGMDSGVQFPSHNVDASTGDLDGHPSSSGGAGDYSANAHGTSTSGTSQLGAQPSGASCQYPSIPTTVSGYISSPGYMDMVDPLTKYK